MSRTEQRALADFILLEEAAVAGERCPQSFPHGPIASASIGWLYEHGKIRSEVYAHNWRVVTILDGPNKGSSTAPAPTPGEPYLINGRSPGRARASSVPVTLAKTSFGR